MDSSTTKSKARKKVITYWELLRLTTSKVIGGHVIQARDDDDIVHGGKGDDSIQAGFGKEHPC